MKYLGIDYGTKRIGVAVSDDTGALAFPLTTVPANPEALQAVHALVKENRVEKIILGESRNFKNEPNSVMEDIEQFKKDLEEVSGLPVEYQQEFMTSMEAARQYEPGASPVAGLRPRGSRKANPSQEKLDAAAAALILQSYLDRTRGVQ